MMKYRGIDLPENGKNRHLEMSPPLLEAIYSVAGVSTTIVPQHSTGRPMDVRARIVPRYSCRESALLEECDAEAGRT
jgi:hypothetical protein